MLKEDFKITAATSGAKALELAIKDPQPDLILLDIIMPEMDGYEVCTKLKQDPKTYDIPVVFLTSLNNMEDIEKGFSCGAAEFISKPVVKSLVRNRLLNQLKVSGFKKKINIESELPNTKDTVLVVDDAPENVEVIMEILKEDYNILFANSGEKAIDILKVQKPDLVLLDILMPGVDGYDVCKFIKDDSRLEDIPVIFLTILENSADIVQGLNLGAVDYVCKPVEPVVLKAKIKTHLKLKHYHDKLKDELAQKDTILYKQSKLATLGEMFENITHQWKQPLSVIALSNQNIKLQKEIGALTNEMLFSSLEDIESSTKHLSETVTDFRDFLNEETQREYIELKEVIDKTLKLLSSKFKNKEIEIIEDIEDLEVLSRKSELLQVFMNIFSNALDAYDTYAIDNKVIKVTAKKQNNAIVINIVDNAGGIDEAIMDSIFDKYVTTKQKNFGTGVGLYMSKKLVEESLSGTISCSNENNGANFQISLPLK
jgi:CheY-like chemotaxis protein